MEGEVQKPVTPTQKPAKPTSMKILQWVYFVLLLWFIPQFLFAGFACGGSAEDCRQLAIGFLLRLTPLSLSLVITFVLLVKYSLNSLKLALLTNTVLSISFLYYLGIIPDLKPNLSPDPRVLLLYLLPFAPALLGNYLIFENMRNYVNKVNSVIK
jgi:hypothetical protein